MQSNGFESPPDEAVGDARNCSSGMACVVIGRNEGSRLIESLHSVQASGLPLVYVDSGSSDGSAESAEKLGIRSLRLSTSQPFSAARARNRGLDEVDRCWPGTRYVLFLDGDCTLEPNFPLLAANEMGENAHCAIVTGHLAEQYPERSIYNRLCSIEWRSPAGRIDGLNALGGIMVGRIAAFREVGGFNEQAIAGEEADLAARLRMAGYFFVKVDAPMATHDARILTFRQWWIRAVRGGYGLAHRYAQHGRTGLGDGRREVLSALFWGLALPVLIILSSAWSHGVALLLLGGYVVLALRMYSHYSRQGFNRSDSFLSARFGIYAKFAHLVGILRYFVLGPKRSRIIEYK